jgi:hypothetical protein
MAELEQAWPSIVVNAKDGKGGDLVDVRVRIDGAALLSKLDGTPTLVDPGPHVLRFEAEGAPAVERQVVVHSGEKSRLITVQLAAPAAEGATRSAAGDSPRPASTDSPPVEPPQPDSAPRIAAWIFGGIALAAFGTEAYFGVSGLSDRSNIEGRPCAQTGTCAQSDVDAIRTKFIVADVALGTGLVSSALAVYFFLTGRPDASTPPPQAAGVDVSPLPGGAGMNVSGRF